MAARPALRKAIITHDLSMPELVNVVANIVGVWPLIVSYLKETDRKDEGDSLVVRSFLLVFVWIAQVYVSATLCCFYKKGMDGYVYHDQLARMKFRLFHLLLEICKYHHQVASLIRVVTWWLRIMFANLSEYTRTVPRWFHVFLFLSLVEFVIVAGRSQCRPVYDTCFCFSCQ